MNQLVLTSFQDYHVGPKSRHNYTSFKLNDTLEVIEEKLMRHLNDL